MLTQIEADVIIEITCHDYPAGGITGAIFPYWECFDPIKALRESAANKALRIVEQNGGGFATFTIHDFRKLES